MTDSNKVRDGHLHRAAVVYVRQSTANQVEQHRESTQRQYALVEKAVQLGWAREQVTVIDQDQGRSADSAAHRGGFARMTAALGGPADLLERPERHLAEAPLRRPASPARCRGLFAVRRFQISRCPTARHGSPILPPTP